jgi:uncharacterized membrane protein YdcZ (DUF606 family)
MLWLRGRLLSSLFASVAFALVTSDHPFGFLPFRRGGAPRLKQAIAVLCIAVASLTSIALVVDLVISIAQRSYAPWWFWTGGVLGVGVLAVIAGILLGRERGD